MLVDGNGRSSFAMIGPGSSGVKQNVRILLLDPKKSEDHACTYIASDVIPIVQTVIPIVQNAIPIQTPANPRK